jgi:hypothetical protein
MKRRKFLQTGGKLGMLAGALALSPQFAASQETMNNKFVHHVFFWLKEPDNEQHIKQFQEALHELVKINSIHSYHLGKPADTRREVIDSSYHYSLLTIFSNQEAHDHYQIDPIHDVFRQIAGDLCAKVIVYDSVEF